jgi:hypothetical protein
VAELVVPAGEKSGAAGPARSSTPIVHVVFDELPVTTLVGADGTIDAELFPNFAAFAEDATWYRNATTVAALTLEAVPAQLSGNRPRPGSLPTARQHPNSLFTLFSRSHDLVVVEPLTDVCPADLCAERRPAAPARMRALAGDLTIVAEHLLLPDDLRAKLPPIDRSWAGFGAPEPTAEDVKTGRAARPRYQKDLLRRLRTNDASKDFAGVTAALARPHTRPPLVFLHSSMPHSPWRYLPDGRSYGFHRESMPGLKDHWWTTRQWLVDQAFQRHVLQVQYTDALLGRLMRTLGEEGLYDRAVIVLTADHGSSFRAGHPRRELHMANLPELAGVPLFVKVPGQRDGEVDDRAVRSVDVLPTIAKAAGVRMPFKTEGIAAGERPDDLSTPVDVSHGSSDPISRPLSEVVAERRLRERDETRELAEGVFAMGSRPDLVGRRVAAAAPAAGASATVDSPEDFADVDPRGPVLPLMVTGDVTGLRPDSLLAVAVNGRIAATTRVYPKAGGGMQYVALLPPASLARGRNRVTVLQVSPGDRLHALGAV